MAQDRKKSKIKSDILLRVRILYLLFFFVGLFILGRLIWVQYLSREVRVNAKRIERRIFREERVIARRGDILARNNEELATSIFRYRVTFDMSAEGFDSLELFTEQVDSLSKLLSLYFKDRTAEEYRRKFLDEHNRRYRLKYRKDTTICNSKSWLGRFVDRMKGEEFSTIKLYDTIRDSRPVEILPREVDYAEWQILKSYPILNWNMGMVYRLEPIDYRIYPQGELARRVIGRNDDRGKYGIEAIYGEELKGHDGVERRQRIAHGFSGRVAGYKGNIEARDGADILTTIDLDIQDVADKALRSQLMAQNSLWGTTLVMECETGDILAMVNLGRTSSGGYAELENYAIGRRMEPGSTFKLAALLALIEDCGKGLDLEYDSEDGKRVEVGRALVQDSHAGFSVVDLKTATAQSLNVYFAKAIYEAYRDNPQRYVDFLKRLNLDKSVGLEQFGEPMPILPEPGSKIWYPHITLPNMGYGYAVELTPIQILTLYNAVANGGRMVAPRLIRGVSRNGEMIQEVEPRTLVERICSDETLEKVREALEEVALSGTAKYYFGDTTRFSVGAKTGTAKFAQGGIKYDDGYYLGSMVTYLPADNPKYTLLTSIFTRRGLGTTIYGAGLAGPVQKRVASYLTALIPKSGKSGEEEKNPAPINLKGGDLREILEVADGYDIELKSRIKRGWGRVLEDGTVESVEGYEGVPDVRGMGLKDALYILERAGFRVRFSGAGAVFKQTPDAGTKLREGGVVELVLK